MNKEEAVRVITSMIETKKSLLKRIEVIDGVIKKMSKDFELVESDYVK